MMASALLCAGASALQNGHGVVRPRLPAIHSISMAEQTPQDVLKQQQLDDFVGRVVPTAPVVSAIQSEDEARMAWLSKLDVPAWR